LNMRRRCRARLLTDCVCGHGHHPADLRELSLVSRAVFRPSSPQTARGRSNSRARPCWDPQSRAFARCGPPHRMQSGSRCCTLRSHQPRYPPPLAVPRHLRPLPWWLRHPTPDGLASWTGHSTADTRRGHSFDTARLVSPSARERLPVCSPDSFLNSAAHGKGLRCSMLNPVVNAARLARPCSGQRQLLQCRRLQARRFLGVPQLGVAGLADHHKPLRRGHAGADGAFERAPCSAGNGRTDSGAAWGPWLPV
jgi:hypothetical protein